MLRFLERLVLDYLDHKEDPKVRIAVENEIQAGYEHYLEMAGRGEKIRFQKIFEN